MRAYINGASQRVRKYKIDHFAKHGMGSGRWPLPNVWLGVSVEYQDAANERIPELLATPAALRFLSVEPLLGPVDLRNVRVMTGNGANALEGYTVNFNVDALSGSKSLGWGGVDWVICGGESGQGYTPRPMHPDWARKIRDDCKAAGVPFFFKQWGHWHSGKMHEPGAFKECNKTVAMNVDGDVEWASADAFKRVTVDKWEPMCPLGKTAAGAELDNTYHREFPQP